MLFNLTFVSLNELDFQLQLSPDETMRKNWAETEQNDCVCVWLCEQTTDRKLCLTDNDASLPNLPELEEKLIGCWGSYDYCCYVISSSSFTEGEGEQPTESTSPCSAAADTKSWGNTADTVTAVRGVALQHRALETRAAFTSRVRQEALQKSFSGKIKFLLRLQHRSDVKDYDWSSYCEEI